MTDDLQTMRAECVLWDGFVRYDGYGMTRRDGKRLYAHRVAYEDRHGPIPAGMTVDHLCFNPTCVNPEHLRLLTMLENAANQRKRLNTHCRKGHEWTPENTYIRPSNGHRGCRTCNRENVARIHRERPPTPEQRARALELQRLRRARAKASS